MIPGFEWDPGKRVSNLRKHGVDFVRAATIFDRFVTRWRDTRRAYGEPRIIAVGEADGLVLTVVYTVR